MADAAQAGFGPVNTVRADGRCEGGVSRDEQGEAALLADAGEFRAGCVAIGCAEVAVDHAPAPRELCDDCGGIGGALRIGHEPGAGQGAAPAFC